MKFIGKGVELGKKKTHPKESVPDPERKIESVPCSSMTGEVNLPS